MVEFNITPLVITTPCTPIARVIDTTIGVRINTMGVIDIIGGVIIGIIGGVGPPGTALGIGGGSLGSAGGWVGSALGVC